MVHIEPIDGAHNSRAVTAAGAVREELAGCGIVDEFQKSINRLLLRVAGIAHRNIDVAHPEGFHITLLIVGRTVLQIDYGPNAERLEVFVICFIRLGAAVEPVIHLAKVSYMNV